MWPTIIGAAVIAAIFVLIIVSEIRKKKQGKSSCNCGCSCGGCGMSDICHSGKE